MTLNDIKKEVDTFALKIQAPADLLPTYGYSKDLAYPHIEISDDGNMHFVIIERGKEQDRKTTTDLNRLLYWIFDGVTFSMAVQFELKNRVQGQDFRRIMFAKQEELLGLLDNSWQEEAQRYHQKLMPFDDRN